MNQSVLKLTPGGRPLGVSLGFAARAVVVDNYTSSYVVLPDAGKTIPPWTYGAVVTLPPEGIRQARASLVPTVPAVAGPPVPVSEAALAWTDQLLSADPGHLLQQSQYGVQQIIGTLSAATGAVATGTFNVPAGTQAIGFMVYGTVGVPQLVSLQGHTTGGTYLSATNPPPTGGPQMALFSSSDTQVDVSMTAIAVGSSKIDVLASPLLPVVDVLTAAGVVLPVQTDLKAYDWTISGTLDGNGVAVVTQNSPTFAAGLRIVLAAYTVTVVNGAAVAYVGTLTFTDSAGVFWRDAVGIPAVANSADRASQNDLRAKGTGNSPMTMALNNPPAANVFARWGAGGYVV
jgi:hypothetical protein